MYTTSQVYTKAEVDAITGERAIKTPAEGDTPAVYKTLAEMISDVNTQAEANKDAIAILNGKVDEEGSVKKIAADAAKAEVAAVIDSAPDAFDTLKEIAEWIEADETASEALTTKVTNNEKAIEAIEDRLDVVEPQLKKANIEITEEEEVIVTPGFIDPEVNKFEVENGKVTKVSTDLLFNGDNTLVLFGGSATA